MNKILLLIFVLTISTIVKAQVPQKLNYQGVARTSLGDPIPLKNITVRISILDSANSGAVAYQETRSVTTNYVGLFNIIIGNPGASNVNGSIAGVNWATGQKFIQIEVDPNGGTNFSIAGLTSLQSVAYALSASPVGIASGDLAGNYPSPTIANSAITTNKIADANVTLLKLAPNVTAVLNSKVNIADKTGDVV